MPSGQKIPLSPSASMALPDNLTKQTISTTIYSPQAFASLISTPPILDCVFSFLEISAIFRVSWTCRAALFAVQKYLRRAFNIDRHFSRFFDRPHDFRRLLARTKSVVSGSNALQFFSRLVWDESDMDLYVYQNQIELVLDWLKAEGYEFLPREGQLPTLEETLTDEEVLVKNYASELAAYGLVHVLDLSRHENGKPVKGTKIQILVCSPSVSVLDLIFHYRSTCVMNVITHKAAYCAYPRCTLNHREAVFFDKYGEPARYPYQKYEGRGWKTHSWRGAQDPYLLNWNMEYAHNIRYLGDKHCWTVPHYPQNDEEDDPLTRIKWSLGDGGDGPQRVFTRMQSLYRM